MQPLFLVDMPLPSLGRSPATLRKQGCEALFSLGNETSHVTSTVEWELHWRPGTEPWQLWPPIPQAGLEFPRQPASPRSNPC